MSTNPAIRTGTGNLPVVIHDLNNTNEKVTADRTDNTNPEKRNRCKNCCAKVWQVVKKIFSTLFCCFRLCMPRRKPTEKDLELIQKTKERKANQQKIEQKPEERIPSHQVAASKDIKLYTLVNYELPKTTDKKLIEVGKIGSEALKAILINSEYQNDIQNGLKTVGVKIEEYTDAETVKSMSATFAPAMSVLMKFFDEQLKTNPKTNDKNSHSGFDLSTLFGSDIAKAQSFPKSIMDAFEIMILATFDSLEDKKEFKGKKGEKFDNRKIAEIICDQMIFKKLEDPSFAKRRSISPEKFDSFIQHKVAIREIIIQCTLGIPLKQLDQFNTKDILNVIYDMFVFAEAFMRMSADKNGSGSKIRELISNFGKSLNADLPSIVNDLIKDNASMITDHLSDRMTQVFGQGDLEHQRKIDSILGNNGLKLSLEAVVKAEDKRIEFEKRVKDTLSAEELAENSEAQFIEAFVAQKGCDQRIKERVNASELPVQKVVEQLKASAVSVLSDMLCKQIFQPIKVFDETTHQPIEQIPWLRVLWNTLKKTKKLQQHLDTLDTCIDLVINEQKVKFRAGNGIEGIEIFKKHLNSVVQYLVVHFVTNQVEDFIKSKMMEKLFDLMSDKQMLFKLIFDSLFQARISEGLYQTSKDKDDSKTLIMNLINLHKLKDENDKQDIRNKIATLIHPKVNNKTNKLTIEDMEKEGIADVQVDNVGQKKEGRFKELAILEIKKLEDFIFKKLNDSNKKIEEAIKEALNDYFNQPLSESRKKIEHLNDNLSDMVETVVFEIGKLETPFSKIGVKICKKYIIEMLSNLIVPMRDSPYYILNLYTDSLKDKTKLDGPALHKYINTKGDPAATPQREQEQYNHFAKLLYDVLRAKSSLVGVLNSNKTITQIQSAMTRVFDALYGHPVVHLNSSAKALKTYSNISIFDGR